MKELLKYKKEKIAANLKIQAEKDKLEIAQQLTLEAGGSLIRRKVNQLGYLDFCRLEIEERNSRQFAVLKDMPTEHVTDLFSIPITLQDCDRRSPFVAAIKLEEIELECYAAMYVALNWDALGKEVDLPDIPFTFSRAYRLLYFLKANCEDPEFGSYLDVSRYAAGVIKDFNLFPVKGFSNGQLNRVLKSYSSLQTSDYDLLQAVYTLSCKTEREMLWCRPFVELQDELAWECLHTLEAKEELHDVEIDMSKYETNQNG